MVQQAWVITGSTFLKGFESGKICARNPSQARPQLEFDVYTYTRPPTSVLRPVQEE